MTSIPQELPHYRSGAARALVLLHERRLREFVAVWHKARAAQVEPPATDDPDCASLDALLRHVLGAARFYVTWVTERLKLPGPEIRALPDEPLEGDALAAHVSHLLERWRLALVDAEPEALEKESWPAPWGSPFTADGMLEHAVVHPERHALQLEVWIARDR